MPNDISLLSRRVFTGNLPHVEKIRLARQAKDPLVEYFDDPVGFIEGELGTLLTAEQKAIAISVRDNQETNVPAAHGVGKTRLGACLVLWWIFCRRGLCITTAPNIRQVKELLWGEIRKLYDVHKERLGGNILPREPYLRVTESIKAYGFTASYHNTDAFQGIHEEMLLAIQDEANGISQAIDDGASSCTTGSKNRLLRIGNPTRSGTPFYLSCGDSSIRIPVWGHPNVSWAYDLHPDGMHRLKPDVAAKILDEQGKVKPQHLWPGELPRDVIPGAVSVTWVETTRRKKGENSAYWLGRVEGIFPEESAQSIITKSMILAARARYDANPREWDRLAAKQPCRFGLDVGDGGDPHSLARWQGSVLYWADEQQTRGDRQDVTRAANWGWNALKEYGGIIGVDQVGVGSGALSDLLSRRDDRGYELPPGTKITGINFGARPVNELEQSFIPANLKAELFWGLREAMRREEVAIAPLPPGVEEKIIEGFANIYYYETTTGKTGIEAKAKTKQRLGRSTDLEDAIVMGFGVQVEAKASGMDLLFGAL